MNERKFIGEDGFIIQAGEGFGGIPCPPRCINTLGQANGFIGENGKAGFDIGPVGKGVQLKFINGEWVEP